VASRGKDRDSGGPKPMQWEREGAECSGEDGGDRKEGEKWEMKTVARQKGEK
jgi:hypothetical protein